MKRKRYYFLINFLTAVITATLIVFMLSCSSTSEPTNTTTTTTPVLSSISITSDSTADLPISFTRKYTAIGTYTDGSTADISIRVTWSSSDTNIATIISGGLATGKEEGEINIKATLSGINSPAVALKIIPTPELASIAVTPTNPNDLEIGSTQQFSATGTYIDGSNNDITSQVTWISSDNNIATVSSYSSTTPSAGLATGVSEGNTNITAQLDGITSPAVTLTVKVSTLSSIKVTPAFPSYLAVGLTAQFTAVGTYSDGSTANITSEVTWSSSDTNIATIISGGLATGKAEGETNITAALSGVTSLAVTLPVSILSSITISPESPDDLVVDSNRLFKVIGTYTNGVNSVINSQVVWNSTNTGVATISPTGLATGKAEGETNITASVSGLVSPIVTLTVVSPDTTSTTTPTGTP